METQVALCLDITDKVWGLVHEINSTTCIEDVMESEIYQWWVQNGDSKMKLIHDSKVVGEVCNISQTLGCFKDVLMQNTKDKAICMAYQSAYDRICAWCDAYDVAEQMEQQDML